MKRILAVLVMFISVGLAGQEVNAIILFFENGLFGYMDQNGQIVIAPKFQSAKAFSEGVAVARKDRFFGFINRKGDFVVKPKYTYAYPMKDGQALVIEGEESFFVNKQGEEMFSEYYTKIGFLSQSSNYTYRVKSVGGNYGVVNSLGTLVVDTSYASINVVEDSIVMEMCLEEKVDLSWGSSSDSETFTNNRIKRETLFIGDSVDSDLQKLNTIGYNKNAFGCKSFGDYLITWKYYEPPVSSMSVFIEEDTLNDLKESNKSIYHYDPNYKLWDVEKKQVLEESFTEFQASKYALYLFFADNTYKIFNLKGKEIYKGQLFADYFEGSLNIFDKAIELKQIRSHIFPMLDIAKNNDVSVDVHAFSQDTLLHKVRRVTVKNNSDSTIKVFTNPDDQILMLEVYYLGRWQTIGRRSINRYCGTGESTIEIKPKNQLEILTPTISGNINVKMRYKLILSDLDDFEDNNASYVLMSEPFEGRFNPSQLYHDVISWSRHSIFNSLFSENKTKWVLNNRCEF